MEDNNAKIVEESELAHYGVLGMKWGKRKMHDRYGRLTASGTKRSMDIEREYDDLVNTPTRTPKGSLHMKKLEEEYGQLTGVSLHEKRTADEIRKKASAEATDQYSSMSNTELMAAIERRRLESQYASYEPKQRAPYLPSKPVSKMTNEELSVYNDRKALERTYASYQPPKKPPVLQTAAKFAVKQGYEKAVVPMMNEWLKKQMGTKLGVPVPGDKKKKNDE